MVEERDNVVSAITYHCVLIFQFEDESRRILWDFYEEHFVDVGSGRSGIGMALGDLPEGNMT